MGKLKHLLKNQSLTTLNLIFLLAVALRFLYFPENIYFGYDQARDAFISQEILHGELKIVGPTTSIPGINHGALFYYLYAPIYFIFDSNPEGLAIFLRIYNALGVFIIFFIAKNLFDELGSSKGKWVGIISALFFAFSYEQTQYSLFMTHPALAVLTVLLFYFGLSLLLFQNRPSGLIITLLGLGLSFQFHFLLIFLLIVLVLNLVFLHKRIPKLSPKIISFGLISFLLSISTFIVAEIRFGFNASKNLYSIFLSPTQHTTIGGFENAFRAAERYVYDNILAVNGTKSLLLLIFFVMTIYFTKNKNTRDQMVFLFIWLIAGLLSYYLNDTSLYFYGIGASISLLIFCAFLITQVFTKSKIAAFILIIIILFSNFYLLKENNPRGPNKEINVQTGMLLDDQKKVIDYIYNEAAGDSFAVNAFSMPLRINTTWAYLFEWYGQKKYGYLPIWGGSSAIGFEGNLAINNSRSTLPYKRFLIIEPVRGAEIAVTEFMTDESWFTDIIEERHFGDFIVDYQKPK